MTTRLRYIGLDVHKESIVIAIADQGRGPAKAWKTIPSELARLVKTDRRDAAKLAHFPRSGDLTEITVPDEQREALRDLERSRDDAKKAERVARQQLGKFLLRHDLRYSEDATGRKSISLGSDDCGWRTRYCKRCSTIILKQWVLQEF